MIVSVIIPTLKAEEELASLANEIKTMAYHDIDLIIISSPQSCSINRNVGLDRAESDFIIMCDDDTEGYPQDWDKGLIDGLEQTGAKAVGARLLNPNGSLHATVYANYDLSKDFVEVRTMITSCCAIRKTSLRFDEGFIEGGFEDTDFFRRLGGKYFVANTVRVTHRQEGRYTSIPHNRAYYNKKWRKE